MAKSLHVVRAGLRDLVNIYVEGEGDLSEVTQRSFTVSDRGTIGPAINIDMGYVRQGAVELTSAEKDGISDLYGSKARELRENH